MWDYVKGKKSKVMICMLGKCSLELCWLVISPRQNSFSKQDQGGQEEKVD